MAVKRTEQLQPLSRQHHNGLLFCLLLQKGIKRKAELQQVQEFVQWFWFKDLEHHFELEEIHLMPLQKQYRQLEEPLQRMLNEHYHLKDIINENSVNITYETVQQLRDKLEQHIRFEERELFPLIEETISEEQRLVIGAALAGEKDDNCMSYPVKFWE